jgi:hypothetical protein
MRKEGFDRSLDGSDVQSFILFIGIDIATFNVVCMRYQKDTYSVRLMLAIGGLAAVHLFETTLARRRGYRIRLLAYG